MASGEAAYSGTLRFRIWVTRGCYFLLSDGLKRKSRYSVVAITILSIYVFIISFVTLVFEDNIPDPYPRILSAISIVLSVFIIAITLYEDSKKYILDADHSWEVAQALERVYNEYEIAGDEKQIQLRYAEILDNAHTSRRALDYHRFQLSNPSAFGLSKARYCGMLCQYLVEAVFEYWLYAVMVLLPIPPMAFVFTKIVG